MGEQYTIHRWWDCRQLNQASLTRSHPRNPQGREKDRREELSAGGFALPKFKVSLASLLAHRLEGPSRLCQEGCRQGKEASPLPAPTFEVQEEAMSCPKGVTFPGSPDLSKALGGSMEWY